VPITDDAELNYVRVQAGDTSTSPLVSDTEIDYYFDNRTTASANNDKLDETIVWTLRQMKAKLQPKVSETHSETGVTKAAQQHFEHVCETLESWEKRTGLSGGIATIGTINLGIDEESSEVSID
jgi:hypothetical protein